MTKRGLRVPNPNSRGHATKRGLRVPGPNSRSHTTKRLLQVPNPNSRGHTTKRGEVKKERKKEHNTAFAPERTERALGPEFCSECKIFTSQQTTFVWQPVLLIFRWKALRNKRHLYSASSY